MATCPVCAHNNTEGARFCSNCGSPLERQRAMEGERKFASFLFADVAHSTAIAERIDPEDWTTIMNGAFAFMNAAVSRYGGTVSRLMGDAVLALFGAPVAHEDDAERAVRAGLELQEAAKAYGVEIKQRHGIEFEMRVGINTGTAVLAFVGDAIRTEYTAMGDAANVAARLQSAAEAGTVLISADTYRLVQTQFDFRPRGMIEMKGKLAAVESYEVIGVKAVPGRARGLEGLNSPLVGREKQFDLVKDRLHALAKGHGSVVAVIGEAGLGKSRLVAELRKERDAMTIGKPTWFETRAISYGQSIPYYPWRQLGRQILGAMDMDSAAMVRDRLKELVERLKLPARDVPFLETMLAVDTDESRAAISNLPGEAVVGGVAGAVVNAVKASIGAGDLARPQVIVLDDLHWSDSATLELIAQVATLASFQPLMMVCVLRPDRKAASWPLVDRLQGSLGSAFERIELEPLSVDHARELLGNLLQIEDLPEAIRGRILERSEGNPFYLEEVLRSLIDAGQVVREGDHWRATSDIIDAKIPETLAGVLSARIDRLPEATKRVAQTAAVIGRVFMHRVLETVCHDAPASERIDHVEPHIAALSFEQLVRERARDPEREYIFKHALTCEAAYSLLLKARRRELHGRAGRALENLFADRHKEFSAMLAHHFSEADDGRRALEYLNIAADEARKLFALREERDHRDRIVQLHERLPGAAPGEVIDAVHEWVSVRHRLNDYDGVLDRLEKTIELARNAGDKERLAMTLSWTGNIHMVTGFPSRSFPYIEESAKLAEDLDNDQLLLLPMFVSTWFLLDRDPQAGVQSLTEVMKLARRLGATGIEAHAAGFRAEALARLGRFDEARKQAEETLALAERVHEPVKKADAHISVGMAYLTMGDTEKAVEHSRIGASLAEGAGGIECACAGYFSLGRSRLQQRRLDEALSVFGKSMEFAHLTKSSAMEHYQNMIRAGIAVAEFGKGSVKALDALRAALNNARSGQDNFTAADLSKQLGEALIQLGQFDEAEKHVKESVAFFRQSGLLPFLASALDVEANLHSQAGRPEQAAKVLAEVASIRTEINATVAPTQPALVHA
jgi:class 3 adenylate cyclase/tetratricopeptide (TPR) repeat protein